MERLESILLVCDEQAEDRAILERVADLARQNGARLTMACLIEELPEHVRLLIPDMLPVDLIDLFVRWRRERLERLCLPLEQDGIQLERKLLIGGACEAVIREAVRGNHSLVVVNPGAGGGRKDPDFSSVRLNLARLCPRPVWMMKPAVAEPRGPILVSLDVGREDDDRQCALGRRIVDLAVTLARGAGRELLIVQTWTLPSEQAMRNQAGVYEGEVDKLARGAMRAQGQRFDEFLAGCAFDGVAYQTRLMKGLRRSVIPRLAQELQADLVVLGARQTGLVEMVGGGAAEGLLRLPNCSVVMVNPDETVAGASASDLEARSSCVA